MTGLEAYRPVPAAEPPPIVSSVPHEASPAAPDRIWIVSQKKARADNTSGWWWIALLGVAALVTWIARIATS